MEDMHGQTAISVQGYIACSISAHVKNSATLCQNNGLGMQDLMDHCVNQSPI